MDCELLEYAVSLLKLPTEARRKEADAVIRSLVELHRRVIEDEAKDISVSDLNKNLRGIAAAFEEAATVWDERELDVDWALYRAGLRWTKLPLDLPDPMASIPLGNPEDDPTGLRPILRDRARADGLTTTLRLIARYTSLAATMGTKGGRPRDLPSLFLVANALPTFEQYRPGKASSYEDNDFRDFVETVHEIATGDRRDMERAIKAVLRDARKA